jgi:hypothetical protein
VRPSAAGAIAGIGTELAAAMSLIADGLQVAVPVAPNSPARLKQAAEILNSSDFGLNDNDFNMVTEMFGKKQRLVDLFLAKGTRKTAQVAWVKQLIMNGAPDL